MCVCVLVCQCVCVECVTSVLLQGRGRLNGLLFSHTRRLAAVGGVGVGGGGGRRGSRKASNSPSQRLVLPLVW